MRSRWWASEVPVRTQAETALQSWMHPSPGLRPARFSRTSTLNSWQPVTAPAETLIPGGAGIGADAGADDAHYLAAATGQVSPGGVMAVTFTNKAAKMLTRLTAMLPVNARGMWMGPSMACATASCARALEAGQSYRSRFRSWIRATPSRPSSA